MKQDHPAKMRLRNLIYFHRRQPTLVSPRYAEFEQAQQGYQKEQHYVGWQCHAHLSKSISALKPGPKAAISP